MKPKYLGKCENCGDKATGFYKTIKVCSRCYRRAIRGWIKLKKKKEK